MGRRRLTDYEKRKKAEGKDNFTPADPRCQTCAYWKYLGGVDDEPIYCCHFALLEGKLRSRITPTECGSYRDKKSFKAPKASVDSIPMTQWGCGGLPAYPRRGGS